MCELCVWKKRQIPVEISEREMPYSQLLFSALSLLCKGSSVWCPEYCGASGESFS